MKIVSILVSVILFNLQLAQATGRCVAVPQTPANFKDFCPTMGRDRCEMFGCDWIEARCHAGPSTPSHQAPFCYLASENTCEAIGCEWGAFANP